MEDDEEQVPFTAYDYWEEVYEDTMEYLKYMMQTTREDASMDFKEKLLEPMDFERLYYIICIWNPWIFSNLVKWNHWNPLTGIPNAVPDTYLGLCIFSSFFALLIICIPKSSPLES